GRTTKQIAAQAIERALADAGLTPRDVDGIMYSPFDGQQFGADDYRAHFGTSHDMWVSTAGGGMVRAGSAPHEAALAIRTGKPLTLEQYLASPAICDPFRKEDCCLSSDGGGAYVMTSVDRARDLRAPVVEVAGVGVGNSKTRTYWAQQGDFTATPQVFAAPGA